MECLFVPKKVVFTVINTKTNDKYLYLGAYENTKESINKINNEIELNKSEISTMIKSYGKNIMNLVKNVSKIFPLFLNAYDNIETIKKKIVYTIAKEFTTNDLYLYAKKKKITNEELINISLRQNTFDGKTMYVSLGHEYSNALGRYYLDPFAKKVELSYNDKLINNNSKLLSFYENIEPIIYLSTYSDNVDLMDETTLDIFFPFKRINSQNETTFDKIKVNIKESVNIENYYEDNANSLNFKYKDCILKDVIFKSKISTKNLNLEYLFNTFECDKDILFVKFNNDLYKFYNSNNYEHRLLPLKKKNYYVKYDKNHYNPNVPKEVLLKWFGNQLSICEKQYLKEQAYIDKAYVNIFMNSCVFKIRFYDSFIEIRVNSEGEIFVKCLNVYLDESKQLELFKKVNTLLSKISKINKSSVMIISYKNVTFLQCSTTYDIEKPDTNMKKIKSSINYFKGFFLLKTSDSKNKINMLFLKVNNFNSLLNYKQVFLTLKENYSNYTVSQFEDLWLSTTEKMFGLSNSEALYYLGTITEEYSKQELNQINIDYDVLIEIKLNYSNEDKSNYTISLNNCNSLGQIALIREIIEVIFKKANEIKRSINVQEVNIERNDLLEKQEKVASNDDDDIDLDLDLDLDLYVESDDDEDNDIDIEKLQFEEKLEENVEDVYENESVKFETKTMRNYMKQMRNLDPKLYKYKTSDKYTSFSIKCGAVDMRQPIIMSKNDMINFKNVNPDAYNQISKLEWGSSKSAKNFYMCPRIYCIRDKIALTDDQLINNQGKCPFCDGEIIDSQNKILTENQTVIIRRAGSNKYWSDQTKPKSELWKKYLNETEKDAYPGFLDPKLHPNGMCMPCCNTNKNWNYSKCMIHYVDYVKDDYDENFINETKEDDVVLFLNKGIFSNKSGKWVQVEKYTKLDIPLNSGMTFVSKNDNTNKAYELGMSSKGSMTFKEKNNVNVSKGSELYLLGPDKFPLYENKYGKLPKILDDLLGNFTNEKIVRDRIETNTSILVRYGVIQEVNSSFLNTLCKILNIDTKKFIEKIIKNLDPYLFMSLNNGDIYSTFINQNDYKDYFDNYKKIFEEWKKHPLNETFITKNKNEEMIFNVYFAMERYKNFLGDMNINKEPYFFIDLLSRKLSWLQKNPLNVLIVELVDIANIQKLYIHVPNINNLDTFYDNSNDLCIIFKHRGVYEPIVEIASSDTEYELNKVIKSQYFIGVIKKLFNVLNKEGSAIYNEKMEKHSLPTISEIKEQYKDSIKNILVDNFNRGIGIVLNNDLPVFCHTFRRSYLRKYPVIEYKNIKVFNYDKLKELLIENNINYSDFVINNGVVDGLLTKGNIIYPIQPLQIKDEYEIYDTKSNVKKIEYYEEMKENTRKYEIFKKEFSFFFNGKSRNLKTLKDNINYLIENPILDYTFKLNNIYRLLNSIGTKIVHINNEKNSNINCAMLNENKCVLNEFCFFDEENKATFEFLQKSYVIDYTKCKIQLSSNKYNEYIKKLTSTFLTNFNIRMEILNNIYSTKKDDNQVIYRENINTYLKKIYNQTNFYMQNSFMSFPKVYELSKEFIKNIDIIPNITNEVINATTTNKQNISMDGLDEVKAGECIFPFKVEKEDYIETYNQCIPHVNPLDGDICATEVDDNGFMTKYGYCGDNKPKKEVKTIKKKKTKYILPDKWETSENTLTNGGYIKGTKHFKSLKEAVDAAENHPNCVAILYEVQKDKYTLKDNVNKKTFLEPRTGFISYILKGSDLKIKIKRKTQKKQRVSISKVEGDRITIDGEKCIIPFIKNEKEYNDCIELTNGLEECPTQKTENNYRKYKTCKALPINENELLKNYGEKIENKRFKGGFIRSTGKILTLKKAIEIANMTPECIGVMYNDHKKKFALYTDKTLVDEPGFYVYLKK